MSVHDGHRDRIRKRFASEGLDKFTDIQVLELLLFYCISRKDTNELAHALLNRFGSLSQVMETSVEELMTVEGIGYNTAVFLTLIPAASRFYSTDRSKRNTVLKTLTACGNYLKERFVGRSHEMVFMLCLDAKCKVLCCQQVGEGSVNSAGVSVRRVVEMALAANATTVVLAHNHPSGLAFPSHEDVLTTRRLAAALDAVDIMLADHIIVADDDFTSMVQSGYYRPEECTLQI